MRNWLQLIFNQSGVEAHYVNPKEAGSIVTNEPGNAQVLPEVL